MIVKYNLVKTEQEEHSMVSNTRSAAVRESIFKWHLGMVALVGQSGSGKTTILE